jgi:regulator of sigma E protease
MTLITTVLAFLVALGILVTVHEFGHYWVARRCGVKVLRFSVGFGGVIWSRTDAQGTEWAVSWIPLGGYVSMLDERDAPVAAALRSQAFNLQPVSRRIAIVLGGPMANLLLASALYAGIAWYGAPEPAAVLGKPEPASPAALAGVEKGDRILSVDGRTTQAWSDARWKLLEALAAGQEQVKLGLERAGRPLELRLDLSSVSLRDQTGDLVALTGIRLKAPQAQLGRIEPGSPADRAGLQSDDLVMRLNDLLEPDATQFVRTVRESQGRELLLEVRRQSSTITLTLRAEPMQTPQGEVWRIGAQLGGSPELMRPNHGLFQSLSLGVQRTWDVSVLSLSMMARMITGEVSWQNLSGPVTIADYAGQTARMGMLQFVTFLALVSVSLGVLNLLPIPMLDGGHLLYYLIEIVKGSPVSDQTMLLGQRVGIGLLSALTVLALFNDLSRLFG